jgi:cytochrome c-type biogenesis protein CcmH/NrfG
MRQLGDIYVVLRRYDKATEAYAKAVELKPDDADLRYMLGVCAYRTGNKELGMEQYRALRPLKPATAEKLFHLLHSQ